MNIHPKAGGAALGGTIGVLITAVLASIHGVNLAPELPGAIAAFLAALGAYLAPSPAGDPAPVTLLGEPILGQMATTFTPTPAPVTVNVHPPAAPATAPSPAAVPLAAQTTPLVVPPPVTGTTTA